MRLIDVEPVMDSLKKEEQYAHDRVREAPYNGLMVWSMILQEVGAVIHELESQPTVDAVPVRHGKWNCEAEDALDWAVCSVCKWDSGESYEYAEKRFAYCPHCGARMDAERKEE